MRALVTGASGFVGSHVVRTLVAEGHETVALVRPASSLQRLDGPEGGFTVVRSEWGASGPLLGPLAGWRPEACIHLAWYAVPGKYLDAEENVDSLALSLRLLEELAAAGCEHVVMAGTCAEYDTDAGYLREDGPTRPATIYAACKLAAGLIGEMRAAALGVGFTWARLFYLYGPHEDSRRLVPALINSLLDGREFPATSGTQVRDYLHVEDVAQALCSLAAERVSGTFNVCSGEPITMAALMGEAGRLTGNGQLIRFGTMPPRDWEPAFICGDSSRLRDATGWAPRYSLAEGLSATVAWWKQFRAAISTAS